MKINVIYYINRMKKKTYMIITIDTETAFYKILHSPIIKSEQRNFLNMIKIYEKPTVNIIHHCERLDAFPVRSETKQLCLLSPYPFSIVLLEITLEAVR